MGEAEVDIGSLSTSDFARCSAPDTPARPTTAAAIEERLQRADEEALQVRVAPAQRAATSFSTTSRPSSSSRPPTTRISPGQTMSEHPAPSYIGKAEVLLIDAVPTVLDPVAE